MGKLWEPDERYRYNRNKKRYRNTYDKKDNGRRLKKLLWQSAASLLIFFLIWGIFQFNGTYIQAVQSNIRGWFTEDYDIQPVIKLFSDVGLWGDTLDRAAYEASSGYETGPLVIPVSGKIIKNSVKDNTGENEGDLKGLAIIAQEGTLVRCAHAGIVTRVANDQGLGRIVEVTGNDGFVTRYAHLSEILVSLGDKINAGQIIAKVGSTGNVNNPQLFFQIIHEGKYIDPENVFIKNEKI